MGVKHFVLVAVLLVDIAHISGLPVKRADGLTSSIKDGSADQISEETVHVERSVEIAPTESDEYDAAAEGGDPEEAPSDERSDRSIELQGGSQNFFPSFANLFEPRQPSIRLGSYANQEGAYSQRPSAYRSLLNNYPIFGGFRNSDGLAKHNAPAALIDSGSSLLGSGNFGVIRGGTFFGQSDTESDYSDGFNSFYNNGHGRPSLYGGSANPRPTYNQDQFANFRDFADINTPSNPAYSHFVVVYANKNATVEEVNNNNRRLVAEPKNIIETLALLDKEFTNEDIAPMKKESKLSKTKLKLAKTKLDKKSWKKIIKKTYKDENKDAEEPLLALS